MEEETPSGLIFVRLSCENASRSDETAAMAAATLIDEQQTLFTSRAYTAGCIHTCGASFMKETDGSDIQGWQRSLPPLPAEGWQDG